MVAITSDSDATIHPCLESLPSEVLLEIFSHLAPSPSLWPDANIESSSYDKWSINISLRNVKAVCKLFAALVTPLITAHYCDGDFYHLRLNAQKPENWDNVKTVILDDPLYGPHWPYYRHGDNTFQKFLKLRDVDERLGLSEVWRRGKEDGVGENVDRERVPDQETPESVSVLDQDRWKKQILQDRCGLDVLDTSQSNYERAVVLCLCPKVEEALYGSELNDKWCEYSDDPDFTAIAPIVSAAKGESFGRVHKFEKLKYLSIDVQFMQIGDVIPVMRLPSLQHLVLEWRNWASGGFDGREADAALRDWGCPDRSSNVDTLELRKVACPSSILRRLLRSCKELRSFTANCEYLVFDNRNWYVDVFDELKEHARTLKELVITRESGDDAPFLGASVLEDFAELKRLRIQFRLITGNGGKDNDASKPSVPDLRTLFPPSLRSIELDIYGTTPYDETTTAFTHLLHNEGSALERVHVINHTTHRKEYGLPEQTYPLPMDLPSLHALSHSDSTIRFDYTLLHHLIRNTEELEWARAKMLRLPHGEELLKHATCDKERKWNELLSRPVGSPLPFGRLKLVWHHDAQSRGWLRSDLSTEELAESIKKYEPPLIYTSIKYNF